MHACICKRVVWCTFDAHKHDTCLYVALRARARARASARRKRSPRIHVSTPCVAKRQACGPLNGHLLLQTAAAPPTYVTGWVISSILSLTAGKMSSFQSREVSVTNCNV